MWKIFHCVFTVTSHVREIREIRVVHVIGRRTHNAGLLFLSSESIAYCLFMSPLSTESPIGTVDFLIT